MRTALLQGPSMTVRLVRRAFGATMGHPMTEIDIAKPGPLMAGKRGLVMGVANERSIAWGIARVLAGQGAKLAFSYQDGAFGRRALPLAQSLGSEIIEPCNVLDLKSVDNVFARIKEVWGRLDFVVHALAFSDPRELSGRYVNTTRENFTNTMVISCFSFTEIAKRADRADARRRLAAHLELRRRHALGAVLQRDGSSEGGARSLRALSRRRSRAAEHPRQRALGRPHAHAVGRRRIGCARHLQFPEGARAVEAHAEPRTRSAARRCICCRICPALSPARCTSSTAATRPSPCRASTR